MRGIPFEYAKPIADNCVNKLAPYCREIEIAGEIRSYQPTTEWIKLVCVPNYTFKGGNMLDAFLRDMVRDERLIPVTDVAVPGLKGVDCRVYTMPMLKSADLIKLVIYTTSDISKVNLDNPGAVYRAKYVKGSETSKAAAEGVSRKVSDYQRQILEALKSAGAAGLTDYQIQQQCEMSGDSERPRRVELVGMGEVCPKLNRDGKQEKRKVGSKRPSGVWVYKAFATQKAGV